MTSERRVTLVCGPPCGGKTTWVQAQASVDGGQVLDWDDFARASGSTARWNHPKAVLDEAEDRMQHAVRFVEAAEGGIFYVIRCLPMRSRREALAERLRADRVVVLLPSMDTLMFRAGKRSNVYKAERGVRDWLRDYTPSPRDELVTG